MNAQKRAEIFSRLQQLNPHPTTELEFSSPFELLAAVLLSAQATDVSVSVSVDLTPGHERTIFSRSLDFYHQQHFLLQATRR